METFLWKRLLLTAFFACALVRAEDIFVFMNDPRLQFSSSSDWNFHGDTCFGRGFGETQDFGASVSLSFTGISVSVYYLVGSGGGISKITLDGKSHDVDTCSFAPAGNPSCVNNPWNNTPSSPLKNGTHKINVSLQGRSPNTNETGSWAYLDIYAFRYTTLDMQSTMIPNSPTISSSAPISSEASLAVSSKSPLSAGSIAGIAIGCAALAVILFLLLFSLWRKRKHPHTCNEYLNYPTPMAAPGMVSARSSRQASALSLPVSHASVSAQESFIAPEMASSFSAASYLYIPPDSRKSSELHEAQLQQHALASTFSSIRSSAGQYTHVTEKRGTSSLRSKTRSGVVEVRSGVDPQTGLPTHSVYPCH